MSNPFDNAKYSGSSIFRILSPVEKKQAEMRGHLSAVIYNERHRRKMSQSEFADFMGVSQAMVSKWESCSYNFSMDTLLLIADKLSLAVNIDVFPVINKEITIVVSSAFFPGTAGSCYYENLSTPEDLITLGG